MDTISLYCTEKNYAMDLFPPSFEILLSKGLIFGLSILLVIMEGRILFYSSRRNKRKRIYSLLDKYQYAMVDGNWSYFWWVKTYIHICSSFQTLVLRISLYSCLLFSFVYELIQSMSKTRKIKYEKGRSAFLIKTDNNPVRCYASTSKWEYWILYLFALMPLVFRPFSK